MLRTVISALFLVACYLPSTHAAQDLDVLEEVVAAAAKAQPGLMNYHARVETSRIDDMIRRLTKGIPDDVQPPPTPTIFKFWQRQGPGLVYADNTGGAPYVAKMVAQVSDNLAVELNEMLLPADRAPQRRELVRQARVKRSQVALADNHIQRVEIRFNTPSDLEEAFFVSGMRLPQKNVAALAFDVDERTKTVNEMSISTADGLQLTVEIRYVSVTGGHIPERFQVTSPDGRIEDIFEVRFTTIDGYTLPASMLRKIRRPEIQDTLEVHFKDYRINQAVSPELESRLKAL